MRMGWFRVLLMGIVLGACAGLHAQDQLQLDNGDVIHGTFLGQTDSLIYFESEFFGTIKVPTRIATLVRQSDLEGSQAESLDSEESVVPVQPEQPKPVVPVAPPKPPVLPTPLLVQEESVSSGLGILWETAEKTLNRFVHDRVPDWFPRMPKDWKGQLRFGYNLTEAGTTNTRYHGEFSLDGTKSKSNYQFKSYFAYAKQSGIRSENDWGLSGRFRYKLEKKGGFFETLATHDVDELFDPRYRSTSSVGWGVEPFNSDRLKLDTVLGGAVEQLQRRGGEAETSFKVNLNQNLQWKFNQHMTFKQSLRFYVSPTEDLDYNFRFESGLDALIVGAFNLGLSYRLDYDSAIQDADSRSKSRIITSVGVKF